MLCYFLCGFQEYLVQDEFKQVNEHDVDKRRVLDSVVMEGELRPSTVVLTGVSAKWIVDGEMSLIDLNIDIRAGQLVAVIGTVGCGKVFSKRFKIYQLRLIDNQTDNIPNVK